MSREDDIRKDMEPGGSLHEDLKAAVDEALQDIDWDEVLKRRLDAQEKWCFCCSQRPRVGRDCGVEEAPFVKCAFVEK